MKNALAILAFLRRAVSERQGCVLVTLTDVVGSSARSPGTHMAVASDGSHVGSFSGGCVEAAVVAEALAVLDQGSCRRVRFGAGSPYIDIRLPCGGGMDLLFTPNPPAIALDAAIARLEAREGITLDLGLDGTIAVGEPVAQGWKGAVFRATHEPALQLVIVGHGSETVALARLAQAFAADVRVASPDRDVLAAVGSWGATTQHLVSPSSWIDLAADASTAIVFLFHDHEWEPDLLRRALATTAFYIGAMGSRATHASRCEELLARGTPAAAVGRIVSPAGLIPASRDPDTLALSILSQVALEQALQRAGSAARRPPGATLDSGDVETASRQGIDAPTPRVRQSAA